MMIMRRLSGNFLLWRDWCRGWVWDSCILHEELVCSQGLSYRKRRVIVRWNKAKMKLIIKQGFWLKLAVKTEAIYCLKFWLFLFRCIKIISSFFLCLLLALYLDLRNKKNSKGCFNWRKRFLRGKIKEISI